MPSEYANLGALAIIFIFAVKEFFSYLKSRKENGNGRGNEVMLSILKELKAMNENHLHTLTDAINNGNNRVVDAISHNNANIVELIGEIKGRLEK